MVKPQAAGTMQYIEWLVLIDRAQPSCIAGVCVRPSVYVQQIKVTAYHITSHHMMIRCVRTGLGVLV